jgi:hypothetical protein
VSEDPRSGRVAVVADALLDDRLDELRNGGWGVIQLPPIDVDLETARGWLELAAEQIAEYRRTGYEVVLLDDGVWTTELAEAVGALRVEGLPAYEAHAPAGVASTPSSRRRRAG